MGGSGTGRLTGVQYPSPPKPDLLPVLSFGHLSIPSSRKSPQFQTHEIPLGGTAVPVPFHIRFHPRNFPLQGELIQAPSHTELKPHLVELCQFAVQVHAAGQMLQAAGEYSVCHREPSKNQQKGKK